MPALDAPIVVKVGGSLFDMDDLGSRLRRWLERLPTKKVLLIPGGGAAADVIRDLDRRHRLGEEAAHWLALRVLGLNAHLLAALLANATVVTGLDACPALWQQGRRTVLDVHAFAQADDGQPGSLLHAWGVTSDSMAARAARLLRARLLILLKSMTIPEPTDWRKAGRHGWVDTFFAEALDSVLEVRAVNFRDRRP